MKQRKSTSRTKVKMVKEGIRNRKKPTGDGVACNTGNFDQVATTGSTLLDLAISGNRVRGGGIPGGILVEVFGPSSSGKTALLAETAASVQANGGEVRFLDTEARLDRQYSEIYGLYLEKENYKRPDLVSEFIDEILTWEPKQNKHLNLIAADSLAALSTELEMSDKGDVYGMKRAKEFSEGMRKTCRLIAKNNWIVMCSNQERGGPDGTTTPGGKGIPYYASLRIRVSPAYRGGKIRPSRTIRGKALTKVIGIKSECEIKKSSLDDPFRKVPIYIIFDYGIDDVRGNLIWLKEHRGKKSKYLAVDEEFSVIDKAIAHIEANGLEEDLKEMVIDLWEEIEEAFKQTRKKKSR